MEKHTSGSDVLNAEERRELPEKDFGIPQERKFPMPDAEHVRSAEAYFHTAPDKYKPELAKKILEKAREFGVNVKSEQIRDWAGGKAGK